MNILLSNGNVAKISKQDKNLVLFKSKYPYQKSNIFKWHEKKVSENLSYAVAHKLEGATWKTIRMHRIILGVKNKNIKVDHLDGNGLNNKRENLRICSQQKNTMNSRKRKNTKSKFKGVTLRHDNKKWVAQITHNYKNINLGSFDSEYQSALAYNKKAKKIFGRYAKLNKI